MFGTPRTIQRSLWRITLIVTVWRIALIVTVSVGGFMFAPTAVGGEDRGGRIGPNIVLMMADDLGWGDTGFNGHPVIKTPSLDEMAANGLVFRRFYAGSAVCSPTRGSCLTGRHPDRYGIPTANAGHLRPDEVSLAEVLGGVGYRTGHFGKWHLGTLSPEFSGKGKGRSPEKNHMTPGMAGFDEWFSTEYAVATWDPYDPAHVHDSRDPRALYWLNGSNIVDGEARGLTGDDSRIVMDRAIPFIEAAARGGEPFLAVIWFHTPHLPVIGGPEYRAMYSGQSDDEKHYFAVITALDEQVGRLRNRLRSLGVADETMIWFCSDNGPEGNPGPVGRSQGTAGPFRGRKRSLYEGGIRVPAILDWPEKVRGARTTDFPAVTSDYVPTILDSLGRPTSGSPKRPLDGISLVPLIEGRMSERPVPIAFRFGTQAALCDNRFKLVQNEGGSRPRSDNGTAPFAQWELYDLIADPCETNNVANRHPVVVDRMRATLSTWRESCKVEAQRSVNSPGHQGD